LSATTAIPDETGRTARTPGTRNAAARSNDVTVPPISGAFSIEANSIPGTRNERHAGRNREHRRIREQLAVVGMPPARPEHDAGARFAGRRNDIASRPGGFERTAAGARAKRMRPSGSSSSSATSIGSDVVTPQGPAGASNCYDTQKIRASEHHGDLPTASEDRQSSRAHRRLSG
jgi:hypothetical protein